jgi:hypothetical protein
VSVRALPSADLARLQKSLDERQAYLVQYQDGHLTPVSPESVKLP